MRHSITKMLLPMVLFLSALGAVLPIPMAAATVGLADANVTVFTFTRAATSLQPPSASGTVSVNTQTGTVSISLQGFTPGAQLQLLFTGLANVMLGPVTVDMSGNGVATFTLPPGQYSGSFQLTGLNVVQMATGMVSFTIGLVATTTSQSTSTTASQSTATAQQARQPPGLFSGWATSTITVMSTSFSQTIILNGAVSVTISSMRITSSSNGQVIAKVASNDHIAQVQFDHDGHTMLVIHSSVKPAAVYADDRLLVEASSSAGLTFNSNAWVYDQTSGTITVFADPSTITTFYGSAPTPIPELPTPVATLTMIFATLGAVAAVFAVRRGKRSTMRN